MASKELLLTEIQKLHDEFYAAQSKNMVFKDAQKIKCANTITQQMDVDALIKNTFYNIQNTNHIFIDYTIFKLYANQDIYMRCVGYLISLFSHAIEAYGNFEVHLNLDTFTIASTNRYRDIIHIFLNSCLSNNTKFTEKLNKMHIYNIPLVFDNIKKMLNPFIHISVRPKIITYTKAESASRLQQIRDAST
jgi:hypothetical protein